MLIILFRLFEFPSEFWWENVIQLFRIQLALRRIIYNSIIIINGTYLCNMIDFIRFAPNLPNNANIICRRKAFPSTGADNLTNGTKQPHYILLMCLL